ncbi:ABC transporter substrate-binding protein [Dietzia sp. NPDC055877]
MKLAVTTLAALALTLTACSGGGETSTAASDREQAQTPVDAGRCTEDKAGGTITMGEFVMLPSFMPGQGNYGVRGAAESAAVYDRLMRWDPQGQEFVPQLAESLESNDDDTVWTLKLRDGVHFSNGDPLIADDVAFTMGLHKDPATRSVVMTEVMQIENATVVDPQTVEFTLNEPWSGFPIVLAGAAGEVIPKKAYQASTPEQWARNPIGAGAFVMDNYIPNQEVVLKPNPDYYGGPVCPSLRFINIPGSQGTFDAFQTGEIQVAFLRNAKFVSTAKDADVAGFEEVTSSGSVINMNTGNGGYDGIMTDERARQAVAYALDRDLYNQRVTGGLGQPTSSLLAESSRFYDGQEGPEYNVDKARSMVDELKAQTGWDGSVTLLIGDSPEVIESGVVVKAMLDAAGFNVTIENTPISQVTARQFTGDYEIVMGGLATSDADPVAAFASGMTPGGATNLTGVNDPELTEAITALKAANELDAQKQAFDNLQEVYNRVMPFTVVANAEMFVAIDETVKGVKPTMSSTMLFDGAYLEK